MPVTLAWATKLTLQFLKMEGPVIEAQRNHKPLP